MSGESDPPTSSIEDTLALRPKATSDAAPESEAVKRRGWPGCDVHRDGALRGREMTMLRLELLATFALTLFGCHGSECYSGAECSPRSGSAQDPCSAHSLSDCESLCPTATAMPIDWPDAGPPWEPGCTCIVILGTRCG